MNEPIPVAGDHLEPLTFAVTEELQSRYLEALEDYHPRYIPVVRQSAPLVHPGILLGQSNATRSPSFDAPNTRWIHLRDRTSFDAPAYLGDVLTVQWKIDDHRAWFGRAVTQVSCAVATSTGRQVLTRTMWGLRGTADERGAAHDEDAGRSVRCAPAARDTLNAVGWEIPGRPKHVTRDRIELFSGRGGSNLHTDDTVARQAGLAGAVASAAHGMGYLCEFIIDNFGQEWLAGGAWSLTFRKPILPGDWIRTSGRLKQVRNSTCTVGVRLADERDATLTDGTATCPITSA